MLLSIITLNYNKKELTLQCVQSLIKEFAKQLHDGTIEIIIVDNKSPDNSVSFLKEKINHKNVRILANKENTGFGRGNNFGASHTKGDYILFLNNDTLIQDDSILKMAQYMKEHPDVAILGGSLQNSDGTAQASAGKFYTPYRVLLLLMGFQKYGLLDSSPKEITQVDWVKGALLMIRKDVFDKLGGFDKNIFMYTEDMELCYRVRQAGFKIYFYPHVKILHQDQGSSNRTFAIVHIYQGLLYFYKKHRTRLEYFFVRTLLQLKARLLLSFGRLFGNSYLTQTYEQALKVL